MPDPAVALTTTRSDAALAPRVYPAQDQNPAAVYLAHLKPSGRRTMHQALNVIAGLLTDGKAIALTCPWGALRFQHTMAIRALVADAYKPATANKMLSALRGTLKMAWRLEQMSAEEYARAADLPVVKGTTLPAGRELESAELDALLRICAADKTPAGARDAALISLLYTAGLRREEAAGLAYADYDPATDRLVVRGKGGKERAVYVLGGAAGALADWLAIRGDGAGALFWPITKTGKCLPRHLTAQAVYNILNKRGKQAGLTHFSPHDMRRTFVSDLLDAGADIATVAKLAGHANVQTTARYDRRPEAAKRKAAGLLQVPYRRRGE
ncbi:MAG TPA: site-specific integrase [Chloroflexia bacterium]|nr:site-specific integrase [Chloroflexia bacterium]